MQLPGTLKIKAAYPDFQLIHQVEHDQRRWLRVIQSAQCAYPYLIRDSQMQTRPFFSTGKGWWSKEKEEKVPESSQTESDKNGDERNPHSDYDHLTPAERRYMEQKQKIGMKKMGKVANKSYKDRMQDFNQYLANLSEHYDIPKVGPG
ncbi:CGI-like protein [Zea mays]|uniref:CGI-like protein n=1 Tax=Zea mays TaxID=4577 RepID=K7U0H0_MAIZE|nr:CGI-like protein [Zea mays]